MLATSRVVTVHDRTRSWSAFAAWALCGVMWGFSYLAVFSVGGVILPFAVFLTVLLAKDGLPSPVRRVAWGGFAGWMVWFGLIVAGIGRASSGAWVLGAVSFLGLLYVAGPAGAGLPLGLGLTAVRAGLLGESALWVTIGGVTCVLASAGVPVEASPIQS